MDRHRHILTWLIAAAVSVTALCPAGAQVLCIGDNGHVAVEPAHPSDACGDDEAAALHEEIAVSRDDCTDVPFGQLLIVGPHDRQRLAFEFVTPAGLAPLSGTPAMSGSFEPRFRMNSGPGEHALRTVCSTRLLI